MRTIRFELLAKIIDLYNFKIRILNDVARDEETAMRMLFWQVSFLDQCSSLFQRLNSIELMTC